ncbi:MAG TPA: M20/M25/M40 family metallo-hydrolase [Acidobacteriaceae bacterium]|jgi:acetylornithine deacetylase/succinyl-diaminopimelate desuccinylase-like protein
MSAADNARIAQLASDRAVHRAFSWLHLHEPQLRRWQTEFVAIPAPPFGESVRAAWFARRFMELGLSNTHIDSEGNVLAELRPAVETPDISAPIVLLSAHLDTVFPAGTDCTPREEGTRILAPGACDNGAGLTALLALAAALRSAEMTLPCTVLFAANVGEEGEGDLRGMRSIFSESPYAGRIATAIALEGAGEATVVDRALGSRRLRVTLTGPGGHSWADAGRPNPILALASALLNVARIPLPRSPRTTLNVGTVQGGTSVNSIPEFATADLDLRSTSSLQLDATELAVLKQIKESIAAETARLGKSGQPGHDALALRVERIGDRKAGALPQQSPLLGSLRAVDRHLGLRTEPRIGSTDANHPLSIGIPALAIGAGGQGGGIHTLDEWYDTTGRDLALRRILLLLLDTCALSVNALLKPHVE